MANEPTAALLRLAAADGGQWADMAGAQDHAEAVNIRCCTAPDCGKPLVKKPGEAPTHYARRSTCDKVCGERKRAHGSRERCRMAMEDWIARQGEAWARPVGEIVADFSPYEITTTKAYGSIPLRPATHVATEANT